jgi:hypothetical protein
VHITQGLEVRDLGSRLGHHQKIAGALPARPRSLQGHRRQVRPEGSSSIRSTSAHADRECAAKSMFGVEGKESGEIR